MGKIVNVLGLGPSLELFEGGFCIGVNDIWSKVLTDVVVCVDERERFTPERMATIDGCRPDAFYSHLNDYKDRPDFKRIELLPYYPDYVCQLDLVELPKSLCSPFIACVIAWKYYDAKEIHVYGVDLLNHPNLDRIMCRKIVQHFKTLKIALREKGCSLIIHGNGILKDI